MKTQQECQEALDADPKNPYLWLDYVKSLEGDPLMTSETIVAVTKTMDALKECKREEWWKEEFVELYGILGTCYARKGWFERADKKVLEGLCVRPDYYPFWLLRSHISSAKAEKDMANYEANLKRAEDEEEKKGEKEEEPKIIKGPGAEEKK